MTQEHILTSGITDTLDIPHAQGQTITLRKLSWQHLKDARETKKETALAELAGVPSNMLPGLGGRCRKGCGEEKHEGACPTPEEGAVAGPGPADAYETENLRHADIV